MVSREDGVGAEVAAAAAAEVAVATLEDHSDHDAITLWGTSEVLPAGSEILTYRKIEERPHRDFLMHQQGFLSGKTAGELESVPGYYGGTASYKFVQNARALNQMRVTRYTLSRALGAHHDEYGRVVSDAPAAKLRAETLAEAKAVPFVPYSSVGPDMAFKEAGEYGAFLGTHRPFRPDTLPYDLIRSARGLYGPPGIGAAGASGAMSRYGGYGDRYGGYGDRYGLSMYPSTLYQRLNPTKTRAQTYNELNRQFAAGTMERVLNE
jgi:hypothetical protein